MHGETDSVTPVGNKQRQISVAGFTDPLTLCCLPQSSRQCHGEHEDRLSHEQIFILRTLQVVD